MIVCVVGARRLVGRSRTLKIIRASLIRSKSKNFGPEENTRTDYSPIRQLPLDSAPRVKGVRKDVTADDGDNVVVKVTPPTSQFGSRFLTDEDNVFDSNTWDDVAWNEEDESRAKDKIHRNLSTLVSAVRKEELEKEAAANWNRFYAQHENSFFKDRNWIFRVFPDLGKVIQESSVKRCADLEVEGKEEDKPLLRSSGLNAPLTSASSYSTMPRSEELSEKHPNSSVNILEVGCGVGNVVFPILRHFSESENLAVYCCDFARNAIDVLRNNESFDERRCFPFQWDITDVEKEIPVADGSLDFITLIFVLSAIDPSRFPLVLCRLARLLRPGGRILFRDYGRYDMAQLRFKPGSAISENFYARGDGTRAYFFTREEIGTLFASHAGLEEEFCHVDNKLVVNRARRLKMYRVWLLGQFRKPL